MICSLTQQMFGCYIISLHEICQLRSVSIGGHLLWSDHCALFIARTIDAI